MSQENVEIVRRQFKLFSEGDLDGWAEHWDPEVVVTPPKGWPEGDDLRGIEAWRRQAERLRDSWTEARVEIDDIRPVGADRVLTRVRYVTRGKDTGISFDTTMAAAFFLREGRIIRARYFWDYPDAVEAAGLRE
jgi:ketosteroid isomerase-like protein